MTPAMLQFKKIKAENPDCIVFFRMGDFYETFFDDAVLSSKILDITLTSRDKTTNNTPMAGIPYHALDTYLGKMINAGFKVCIVEQMEDPKKAKGLVKRDVVKIITPGTISGDLLDQSKSNYLCSIYIPSKYLTDLNSLKLQIGFSYIDSTTGEFKLTRFDSIKKLDDELYRLSPKEILIPSYLASHILKVSYINRHVYITTPIEDSFFKHENAYAQILKKLGTHSLKGFGIEENDICINSAGGIIYYLLNTQRTSLEHINSISWYSSNDFMVLDKSTLQNLEIVESPISKNRATLFNLLNCTKTNMGTRNLRKQLLAPLSNSHEINERLNILNVFFEQNEVRKVIQDILCEICDIERLSGKIGLGIVNARDLIEISNSIESSKKLLEVLINIQSPILSSIISLINEEIVKLLSINEVIKSTIKTGPPLSIREGNIIQNGISTELDELRDAMNNGKQWLKTLEEEQIKMTGINTLKVRFNNVFGYYIEVSKGSIAKVPSTYIRKQTLVNAERFITPELKEKEVMILGASDKVKEIEYSIFINILEKVKPYISHLQSLSNLVSQIDVYTSLASTAYENKYVKPIVDDSSEIIIENGRHPVVEWINKDTTNQFITNDTFLKIEGGEDNPLIILTGPNMGGKSTYIRQIALITLMAQMGSFVPATYAHIGCVDRIFTRVGASDNLAFGESTFMVEMAESANILNSATNKSLIILDEVGRGTSTYDGLSIAWAIVEYICKRIKAKTLFATHYHELTQLEMEFSNIVNYTVAVAETNGEIVFLRKIRKGKSEKSFGIHVAKLAGLPKEVISTSQRILKGLEQKSNKNQGFSTPQINIFENEDQEDKDLSKFETLLENINVNDLTPIEALNKLHELKTLLSNFKE